MARRHRMCFASTASVFCWPIWLFLCVGKKYCGLLFELSLICAPQQQVQVETFTSSVSNSRLNCIYPIKRWLTHLRATAIRGHWLVWQFAEARLPTQAWKYERSHMYIQLGLRSLKLDVFVCFGFISWRGRMFFLFCLLVSSDVQIHAAEVIAVN